MRIIAVDWSGATDGPAHKIWLAESVNGEITRLECGRDRDDIIAHLIDEARRDSDLVVGLDFAFSLPAWFLAERGLPDGPALWNLVQNEGERWLRDCEPPFWGRPGKACPPLPEQFRRTDRDVPAVGGIRPKSVFQIGGAGAVGTGSLRGMPALLRLRQAGFAIWPFDDARFPTVIEIYPRALTGGVNKGSRDARRDYLDERFPHLPPRARADAIMSDDAFDALVSALVMQEHAESLRSLPAIEDPQVRLEGAIWIPPSRAESHTSTGSRTTRSDVSRGPARSPRPRTVSSTIPDERHAPSKPFANAYRLPGRRILAGEYPGDEQQLRARNRIASALDAGITVFVDLTHDHELEPYHDVLHEEAARRGVRAYHLRLPVPDMGVPEPHEMRRILDVIEIAERGGHTVYVHCWGGVGRTGTVVGCLLAENGCDGREALAEVARLFATMSEAKVARHPEGSPQTGEQRRFVLDWRQKSSVVRAASRASGASHSTSEPQ